MAWTNLATVGWGSQPTINCNFQYDRRRNGSAMEYQIWLGINSDYRSIYFGYPIYADIWVNGSKVETTTIKNTSPSNFSNRLEYYSSWVTVANKTSGSTSLKIRLYSGSGSTRDSSYSYTMAVDPAGSDISVSSGELGQALTITITKSDPTFWDQVMAQCGDTVFPISPLSQSTTFTFTPPVTLAEENTAGTTVPIRFTTSTYAQNDGSTFIQTKETVVNVGIPASVIPTATLAISDANGYASTYGAYVQWKSAIAYAITGTPIYSSPIIGYSASIDGVTYAKQNGTTGVLQNTGAQMASATVTDARGRASNPTTQSYSVLAYTQPLLTSCIIERCDDDGTPNEEGHYMGITFSGEVTPLNNVNSAVWAVRYKVAGSANWTNHPISALNGVYSVSGHQEVIAAADASAFDVEVTITDDFGMVIAGSGSIPVAYAIMNWRYQGDGMAIGGMNTKAGLQVYMDTEITGDLTVGGDLDLGTNVIPITNGGIGADNAADALASLSAGAVQYNTHDSGSLTADTTKTKTFTATGDGIVMISASMLSGTGTWGGTEVRIELNGTIIAKCTDLFNSAYSGQYGACASAFLKVSTGDVIKAIGRSNRYQSGNTWDLYTNALALGCTLTVS